MFLIAWKNDYLTGWNKLKKYFKNLLSEHLDSKGNLLPKPVQTVERCPFE